METPEKSAAGTGYGKATVTMDVDTVAKMPSESDTDVLFVVDVVLWIVKRFLHLAAPWTWIYEVFTNGYYLLWLLYEWRIRNHYFKFQVR